MGETVEDLRDEIADLVDVPETWRAESVLRSSTLSKAAKAIDVEHPYGSAPMVRKGIRQELAKRESDEDLVGHHVEARQLRKGELRRLRDALQEDQDDVE